jgi:hypothetical protein
MPGLAAAFPEAIREGLADPARRGSALGALVRVRGRLSVGDLEGRLPCSELAVWLKGLGVLRAPLAELLRTGSPDERALAVTALARMGGEESATLLPILSAPASAERRALLDALGERALASGALVPRLVRLAERAADWPTRLRARRALGPVAAKLPVLRQEPLAIVRSATAPVPGDGDPCAQAVGATVD